MTLSITRLYALSASLSLIAACGPAVSTVAMAADSGHPAVIELFQSQGCSSCPPANRNVIALADRPDVLVLSWQVTYWDYLGWKDSFADPAFTARQQAYARSLGHNGVFTPQVVINGRGDVVGIDNGQLGRAIHSLDRGVGGPALRLSADSVSVDGAGKGAVLTLVRYDPRVIQVPIKAGENGGVTLPHRNVVREVSALGVWNGGSRRFSLPKAGHPGLKTAVLLSQGQVGPVLAALHD